MKTKQKQIVTTPEQIKPKFKVGDKLIDMFNSELTVKRIYYNKNNEDTISYELELKQDPDKSYAITSEVIFEENYIIDVLMVTSPKFFHVVEKESKV